MTVNASQLNVSPEELADRTAFLEAASRDRRSVLNHGALVDGTTDDTAAVQATVDDLASLGGGTMLIPKGVAGVLKLITKVVMPRGVGIYVVPGVQVLKAHASEDTFSWEATSATGQGPDTIENLWVEGSVANSGAVFKVATYADLALRNCRCNVTDDKMAGKLLNSAAGSDILLDNCYGLAPSGSNDWVLNAAAGRLTLRKSSFAVGSGFASRIVTSQGGELVVQGSRFDLAGGATGSSTIALNLTGGSLRVSGGSYFHDDVADRTAVKFTDGLLLNVDESTVFDFLRKPYLPAAGAVAATGSRLALYPTWVDGISGVSYDWDSEVQSESLYLDSSNVNPPTIKMRKPLRRGDRARLVVRNTHASVDWTSDLTFDNSAGGHVFYESSGLTIGHGLGFSAEFEAMQAYTQISGVPASAPYLLWVQVGRVAKLGLIT